MICIKLGSIHGIISIILEATNLLSWEIISKRWRSMGSVEIHKRKNDQKFDFHSASSQILQFYNTSRYYVNHTINKWCYTMYVFILKDHHASDNYIKFNCTYIMHALIDLWCIVELFLKLKSVTHHISLLCNLQCQQYQSCTCMCKPIVLFESFHLF